MNHTEIASGVIGEIAKHVHTPSDLGQVQLLLIFKQVCDRAGFQPTEKDARKIFEIVQEEIAFGLLRAAGAPR
jgi:hypothetical protein